jgi:predicted transcriptional regulator
MSQQDLAKILKITQAAGSSIIRGENAATIERMKLLSLKIIRLL